MEDYFQARATADQIIQFVTVDWVVQAANDLLADISAAELEAEAESTPSDSLPSLNR
jgi:hypothetical protein